MNPQPTWIIPATSVKLPDGSTLIKPGKAIQRATVATAVKLTGVPRKTLHALADVGLLTRQRPSKGQAFFFVGEIEDFLKQTEDPEFWDTVKTKALLDGKSLRTSQPM
jgi:hypothetical protein